MSARVVETLLLPFVNGYLDVPGPRRAFLIRAAADPLFDDKWRRALVCEQTFKPAFDRLATGGFAVEQRLKGRYDVGLCLFTKHKAENLINMARAWDLLEPGGSLVCAGANDVGAKSLESRIRNVTDIDGNLSKHHCRVFWTARSAGVPPALAEWLELDRLRPNVDGIYLTRPGMFSWDQVDTGSQLLVETIPSDMAGDVADLGAGWGYISAHLLKRFPGIRSLDLYEAELLALDAARANLAGIGSASRAAFHWHDVARGLPEGRSYDWIVMNPPFHTGKATDVALGRAFIDSAAKALRTGGRLVFVANRQLPYETEMKQQFSDTRVVVQSRGFKVLIARH